MTGVGKYNYDLISVIIPAYNAEKFIGATLDSAIDQSYPHKEIIVVNDGSTDLTKKIVNKRCRAWRKSFKLKLINKENGGTASALNAGIQASTGRWIKWVSADDVMLPGCLYTMIREAKKHKDFQNCIFYSHYNYIDASGAKTGEFIEPNRNPRPKKQNDAELWRLFYGNGSSSLIHKRVFDKCGLFDDTLPHSEDYEFWLRAALVFGVEMMLVPQITMNYRLHPDQLTNRVGGSLDGFIRDKIREMLIAKGQPIPVYP